jgi:hypothetical protein
MLQNRYEYIGATLENKARDAIKADIFEWFQMFNASYH